MMIRLFFGLCCVTTASFLCMLGLKIGPVVEANIAPVKIHQAILEVERPPGQLCWVWDNDKVRDKNSYDNDAYVTVNGDKFSVSVYQRDTLLPWSTSWAPKPGHQHARLCVTLPPHVKPNDRVTLTQTVMFHGFGDLWVLPLRVPDITSPPDEVVSPLPLSRN